MTFTERQALTSEQILATLRTTQPLIQIMVRDAVLEEYKLIVQFLRKQVEDHRKRLRHEAANALESAARALEDIVREGK